jgi:transcription initiation factor TFIIB
MMSDETGVESHTRGQAVETIETAASTLDVPTETTETATAVYRRHRAERDTRPYDVGTTAAACLYVACKVERVPRTVDEVVAATDAGRTHLLRRAKDVTSDLGIDLSAFADASRYVERYADELGLPDAVVERADEVIDVCEDAGIAGGKSPSGWAGAAIYNASVEADLDVRQDTLTDLADVTHVTIRNRYKEQRDVLRERNPPPATAREAVEWYCEHLPVSEYVAASARDLLADTPEPVDDAPAAWAAAALRYAGERAGSPIGMKALKTPAGCSSGAIHERRDAFADT